METLSAGSIVETLLFYLFSAIAIGAALLTILNRNPVAAAVNLIVVMVSLAGLFALLNAHFVAVIQLLVYAGAVMVLFIFVIMLLNLKDGYSTGWISRDFNIPLTLAGVSIAVLGGIKLLAFVAQISTTPSSTQVIGEDFGTTKLVGKILYTEYLLPFEAASILLLAAIIGAVILAKKKIGINE